MSWNFKKVGKNREALKAAVQAELAPPSIKDEVCARIDAHHHAPEGHAIFVESYGHLESNPQRPYYGVDTIVIRVQHVPYVEGEQA